MSGSGGATPATGGTSGNADAGADATTGTDAAANGGTGAVPTGGSAAGGSATGGATVGTGGAPGSGGASAGGGAAGTGSSGGTTGTSTGGAVGGAYAGGASGVAGSNGGTGGAGGSEGGCFPPCLDALVQSCPTTGACTYAVSSLNPIGANFCFSNGVKAQNVTTPLTTSTVKNASGNACYTLETTLGNAGVGYVWKNPAGTTVATATVASATMNIMSVMCDGMTYVVDLNSTGCDGQSTQPSMTNCTLGTCIF